MKEKVEDIMSKYRDLTKLKRGQEPYQFSIKPKQEIKENKKKFFKRKEKSQLKVLNSSTKIQ